MVIHGEGRERSAACNSLTHGGEETGRARGDRAFHWGRKDPREEERERGAGPSWEEKGDGAAAEHFKGMIKGVPHQFLHL